ncbi:MAG TPA: peroxiredoxin, partial [Cytophagales bacterium]|nr:peroxiredoxin [Cytophagales bacterium]
MKRLICMLAMSFCCVSILAQMPKVGEVAPDFTGKDQDGREVTLSKLRGKRVILYFYPKDGTPGCTAQAKSLRDRHKDLTKAGYTVLGVSSDDEMSHRIFSKENSLPFPLIADPEKTIHK